jgi:hypothetical protein
MALCHRPKMTLHQREKGDYPADHSRAYHPYSEPNDCTYHALALLQERVGVAGDRREHDYQNCNQAV